jgi:hypothetical protein
VYYCIQEKGVGSFFGVHIIAQCVLEGFQLRIATRWKWEVQCNAMPSVVLRERRYPYTKTNCTKARGRWGAAEIAPSPSVVLYQKVKYKRVKIGWPHIITFNIISKPLLSTRSALSWDNLRLVPPIKNFYICEANEGNGFKTNLLDSSNSCSSTSTAMISTPVMEQDTTCGSIPNYEISCGINCEGIKPSCAGGLPIQPP